MSEENQILWFRTQAAYEILDLVALESILNRCNSHRLETSISALQACVTDGADQVDPMQARDGTTEEISELAIPKTFARNSWNHFIVAFGVNCRKNWTLPKAALEALESKCRRLENARHRWQEKHHSRD
jgi:hypothetical protein